MTDSNVGPESSPWLLDEEELLQRSGNDPEVVRELLERVEGEPQGVTFEEVIEELEDERIRGRIAGQLLVAIIEDDNERAGTIATKLAPYIDREAGPTRTGAVEIAATLAKHRPERVDPLLAPLVELADDDDPVVRQYALEGLTHFVESHPERVTPLLPRALEYLEEPTFREQAAALIEAASSVRPGTVAEFVPDLVAFLADGPTDQPTQFEVKDAIDGTASRERGQPTAYDETWDQLSRELETAGPEAERSETNAREDVAAAVARAAEDDPAALADEVPLVADLVEAGESVRIRMAMLDVAYALAENAPAEHLPREFLETLGDLLDDATVTELQGRAARVLAAVAERHPDLVDDIVRPRVSRLIECLDSDEPMTRHAAALLLSYVAERDPEAISAGRDRIVELLDDDHKAVRGSAVWALAHDGSAQARDALRRVATDDPDPEIRDLAESLAERGDRS